MNVNPTTGQIVSANTSGTIEQEVARHHVAGDVDDHGIVGVPWGGMELNGNGTEHVLLVVLTVLGHAKTGRFGRHDVFAVVLLLQSEASSDVVGMGVRCDDVRQGETVFLKEVNILLHEIVHRVDQGRFVGCFVDNEVGHGPNTLVQLFKTHDNSEGQE